MILTLESPYKELFRKGYLRTNREGRAVVDLFNSDSDRTTISYARYLLSVKSGTLISNDLEADHKDNNKTNDVFDNLQLLTSKENKAKKNEQYRATEQNIYFFICSDKDCGISFSLTERQVKMRNMQGSKNFYCSRACYFKNAKPPLNSKR